MGFISLATLVFPLLVMRVPSAIPGQPRKVRKLFDSSTLKEVPFCLFLIWGFFGFAGVYMPLWYIGSYAIEKDIMSSKLASYLIPILNAGSVIGRIVPNVSYYFCCPGAVYPFLLLQSSFLYLSLSPLGTAANYVVIQ